MKKSLQEIEDQYIQRGFLGEKLRKALRQDKEYQEILVEKKSKLRKKFKASKEESKYVLSIDDGYEILSKCKKLEKMKLSEYDRKMFGEIH